MGLRMQSFIAIVVLVIPTTVAKGGGNQFLEDLQFKGRDLLQGGDCKDVVPLGAPFECPQYAQLNLCDTIEPEYCQLSCNKCAVAAGDDCTDVLLPGMSDCGMVLSLNLCDDPNVKGIYCDQTCGFCGSTQDDNLVPVFTHTDVLQWSGGCNCGDQGGNMTQYRCYYTCQDEIATCDYATAQAAFNDAFTNLTQCDWFEQEDTAVALPPPPPEPSTTPFFGSIGSPSPLDSVIIPSPQPIGPPSGDCGGAEDVGCDIEALIAFKETVTRGSDLFRRWDSRDSDPCGWAFVTCSQVDGSSERVTQLDLNFVSDPEEFTITAALVPDFSKLRYVNELHVGGQNVTGSLPKEYSVLDRLQEFWAFELELTGTLPSEYSLWSLMKYFATSVNKLTGVIPPEYSAWKFLDHFVMQKNAFTGTVPVEYSEWVDMVYFSLYDNKLTETLPVEFSVWNNNEIYYLNDNSLSGTVPPEYSTMSIIQKINIDDNSLTGEMPVEFSTWKFCTSIIIQDNFLSGMLPVEYSEMKRLETFAFQQNRFTGMLPVEYSAWKDIQSFGVWDNRLSGTLHPEYSVWKFIESFWVSTNSFMSGTLPPEYSTFRFITSWYSSDTDISSNIPDEWSTWDSDITLEV